MTSSLVHYSMDSKPVEFDWFKGGRNRPLYKTDHFVEVNKFVRMGYLRYIFSCYCVHR